MHYCFTFVYNHRSYSALVRAPSVFIMSCSYSITWYQIDSFSSYQNPTYYLFLLIVHCVSFGEACTPTLVTEFSRNYILEASVESKGHVLQFNHCLRSQTSLNHD